MLPAPSTTLFPAGADPSGLTWQPWCDQLVYAVLGALVWGGAALKAAAPDEHEALMLNIQQYMVARPIQVRLDASVVKKMQTRAFGCASDLRLQYDTLRCQGQAPWHRCSISVHSMLLCVPQESVELRPMYGASDAADAAAASDSGGASFLGQLWHAAQVCVCSQACSCC